MSSKPSIDAFLSYHTNDKEIALKIKERLGELGIQVFLAPDDIDGGDKFLTVMYEKIKTCQIFFVLLSKDFSKSQYSDQEVGIALGREKPIIPICIDETIPYGFLREYHFSLIFLKILLMQTSNLFSMSCSQNLRTDQPSLCNFLEIFLSTSQ